MLTAVFVLLCVHVTSTLAAIPFNCIDMTPNNIQGGPETGQSPYEVSANFQPCGSEAIVTLSGTTTFVGYLCQARRTVQGTPLTSGSFTPISNGMRNDCPSMTSLTNIPNNPKTSIQFKWEPAGNETVRIVCTVVKNTNTYWLNQTSDIVDLSCGGTTVSPGTTTTASTGSSGSTTTASTGSSGSTTTVSHGTTTCTTGQTGSTGSMNSSAICVVPTTCALMLLIILVLGVITLE